jgi:hypothetical protein
MMERVNSTNFCKCHNNKKKWEHSKLDMGWLLLSYNFSFHWSFTKLGVAKLCEDALIFTMAIDWKFWSKWSCLTYLKHSTQSHSRPEEVSQHSQVSVPTDGKMGPDRYLGISRNIFV